MRLKDLLERRVSSQATGTSLTPLSAREVQKVAGGLFYDTPGHGPLPGHNPISMPGLPGSGAAPLFPEPVPGPGQPPYFP